MWVGGWVCACARDVMCGGCFFIRVSAVSGLRVALVEPFCFFFCFFSVVVCTASSCSVDTASRFAVTSSFFEAQILPNKCGSNNRAAATKASPSHTRGKPVASAVMHKECTQPRQMEGISSNKQFVSTRLSCTALSQYHGCTNAWRSPPARHGNLR